MILKVTKMLEPLIIVGMGTSIAGLMLASTCPYFDMAGAIVGPAMAQRASEQRRSRPTQTEKIS